MMRALIFDFNGVLADDDPIHMEAFRKVATEDGLSFTDEEYLEKYLPLNDRDCFKTLFSENGRDLTDAQVQDLIRRKGIYYFQMIAEKTVLFENAVPAIRAAARRYPLAIASGARGTEIRHILNRGGVETCFSAIISAEDVQFGKPHPEPFLRAHEKLRERDRSLKPEDCVAVEDSIGGIQSAHGAGMRCLAIAHSYGPDRLSAANPEWVIDSIADFVPWLEAEGRARQGEALKAEGQARQGEALKAEGQARQGEALKDVE